LALKNFGEIMLTRYLNWIVKSRTWVVLGTLLVTVLLLAQLRSLQVIIDPDSTLPQTHPYISTANLIEKIFGNKFSVVIGISAKEGTIFQPLVLSKVQKVTDALMKSPGVVKSNLISLSARKAKDISGDQQGMSVKQLMDKVPSDEAGMLHLQKALQNNPVYDGLLVSKDNKTTQIVAEFKKVPGGFQVIEKTVRDAVAPVLDDSVEVRVSGLPIFLSLLEKYSERMGFLFPIALLIIGLIHYEAFRTVQALILPLVTALLAVSWAMGFLGLLKEPFDVFNATTPIMILAIAAGHAVQILKRYYEEFSRLYHQDPKMDRMEISHRAVVESLSKVGPVMMVACTVAALGFFSLMIFEIKSIRTFGIMSGAGVLSALILELSFIPALRSMLPAPSEDEVNREQTESFWDRLVGGLFFVVSQKRKTIYMAVGLVIAILSLGGFWLKVDNSQKSYFYGKIQARLDDDGLNERMAGTNPIYFLLDGPGEDSIKRPEVLRAMESIQRFIEKEPTVGKTISIVDFLKQMNRSMNADAPQFFKLPDSQELVAQYLLLYSNSGEPGDFDTYVDYGYQKAVITAFMKSDSSALCAELATKTTDFARSILPTDIQFMAGGGNLGSVALNEIMIREKILNILQILGTVFVISSLVFRSLFAGSLILVPLLAAVAVNFGVMGLLGIPLQIATSLVSAIAVGIGADYGIYMSYRMREELAKDVSENQAIEKAFRSAGKAALFVSTAVAGGFGVLMFSIGFMIHLWMGFLIGIAMLVSSITALTVFPALIFSFRPKFIYQNRKSENMEMSKKIALTTSMIAISIFSILSHQVHAAELSALEIAQKSFDTSKVSDSVSDSTFRLINGNGQERIRETYGSTKLIEGTTDNRRYVLFNTPADVKGTKTLLIEHSKGEDDIWIYLPAMKKVRRLVSSNKKDAFVGTDFSYGDVIGHRVEDWNHKVLKSEIVDGKDCYVVESTPAKPEIVDQSGYSKRVGWVDKVSFVALKAEAYDNGGQLLKKFTARKVQQIDQKKNKWQPMELEAENVQTSHKTIIEFKNFKANVGVKEDQFTSRALEK
jgi:predicted RND superfamily exporter protein/outer membrane lipoprotein-sorting protein